MVYHCQPSSKGKSIEKRAIFFFFLIHLKWGMCVGKSRGQSFAHYIVVWRIVLHCLMWCIWQERNSRSFEDHERSILEFKSFFFSTLLKWCLVLPSFSCISLSRLLEHCTLFSWCFCLFSTFPMYGAVFFQYTFKLLIKKKNSHSNRWQMTK